MGGYPDIGPMLRKRLMGNLKRFLPEARPGRKEMAQMGDPSPSAGTL